ncbi:leucyl/phenylalanyl-tRNA--protein transferase [Thalassotalea sp. M1531]|uniref:Leucyl/phenylalanyl-tRNA--protein transferase n=1 Tax=Thalassotalea algicola TaxID=2716224 RepID=A0A7Y0Q7N5_9GAMM|nr:leucyl/phenylalanyl-tRNA--protein transferase [Thalassotalea algicola]NMP32391.1 leucyl/phenylalanyl-tRNA--protein transferase [Thalassotalea algicola]
MSQTITFLTPDSLAFPSINYALAEPNGLLAIGGDLTSERLITAYSNGIFPWYGEDEPIMWWSPHPRAIIDTSEIRINRTLRKVINRQQFKVTINQAFEQVIALCADAPFRNEDTWIVSDMVNAYNALHKKGYAHSCEVWEDEKLVGGLYGVAINGYFSGESMFYSSPNASKVALALFVQLLRQQGVTFIDCQITNPFLESMGCKEISRDLFSQIREQMKTIALPQHFWATRQISD